MAVRGSGDIATILRNSNSATHIVAIPRTITSDATLAEKGWFIVCPIIRTPQYSTLAVEHHYEAAEQLVVEAEVWGYDIGFIIDPVSYATQSVAERVQEELTRYHAYRSARSYWDPVRKAAQKQANFQVTYNGSRIKAIKNIREIIEHPGGLPVGLKDAKDLIEEEWPQR